MSDATLRPGKVETPPARMQALPVFRGYPVPWFVAWINGEPEFRTMDGEKFVRAVREKRCWVCGEVLGKYLTFVIGPMCGINRTTAEPPCHLECAEYSVRNCPFLSKPQMTRRENDLPEDTSVAGFSIRRNPGVSLLWTTRRYELFRDGKGGVLLQVGDPETLTWWREGRAATRQEVQQSVESGLPLLEQLCVDPGDRPDLLRRKARLEARYPHE